MSFLSITSSAESTYEVKRSKFIAYGCNVRDRGQALQALATRRKAYPDARHHCWAYLIGSPQQASTMAMSDDGEPSGTAGKPILNVLQHGEVGNIMVVVSRYFGGVKLGAGGLVRAYSSATQQLITTLETTEHIAQSSVSIECVYSQEQFLRHLLSEFSATISNLKYEQNVILTISVPTSSLRKLLRLCETQQFSITEL